MVVDDVQDDGEDVGGEIFEAPGWLFSGVMERGEYRLLEAGRCITGQAGVKPYDPVEPVPHVVRQARAGIAAGDTELDQVGGVVLHHIEHVPRPARTSAADAGTSQHVIRNRRGLVAFRASDVYRGEVVHILAYDGAAQFLHSGLERARGSAVQAHAGDAESTAAPQVGGPC